MQKNVDICDKEGCNKPPRITLTVWGNSGVGAQMDFCDMHLNDAVKIIIETQKITHE